MRAASRFTQPLELVSVGGAGDIVVSSTTRELLEGSGVSLEIMRSVY